MGMRMSRSRQSSSQHEQAHVLSKSVTLGPHECLCCSKALKALPL
uniref:Uncharacterized protein n=1 Tax=Anguilla anguilla TaxID=7936 RepID=A0A0E9TEE1_ANGAN